MRTLVLLLLGLVAVSAYPKNSNRIVGGSVTTINQYPDMASLLFSWGIANHRQACGGMVLNNRSILTAAHCTYGDAPARWRVRLGSTFANSGGTVFDSAQIINHQSYHTFQWDWDISIIRVTTAIVQSNVIRPTSVGTYVIGDNQVVWAVGWGALWTDGPSSEELRHVQVWTVNQATCRQRYGSIITDNMLCAGWLDVGGRDACQGDSGGPLYHNGVLVGITSFGGDCADPFLPGVNVRVSRFISWINQNA